MTKQGRPKTTSKQKVSQKLIGERIRQERELLGISQQKLLDFIISDEYKKDILNENNDAILNEDSHYNVISHYENGKRKQPQEILIILSKIFNVRLEYLQGKDKFRTIDDLNRILRDETSYLMKERNYHEKVAIKLILSFYNLSLDDIHFISNKTKIELVFNSVLKESYTENENRYIIDHATLSEVENDTIKEVQNNNYSEIQLRKLLKEKFQRILVNYRENEKITGDVDIVEITNKIKNNIQLSDKEHLFIETLKHHQGYQDMMEVYQAYRKWYDNQMSDVLNKFETVMEDKQDD